MITYWLQTTTTVNHLLATRYKIKPSVIKQVNNSLDNNQVIKLVQPSKQFKIYHSRLLNKFVVKVGKNFN